MIRPSEVVLNLRQVDLDALGDTTSAEGALLPVEVRQTRLTDGVSARSHHVVDIVGQAHLTVERVDRVRQVTSRLRVLPSL